ncbi:response regulator transcription factor [Paenibacillus eucommiae]|uniref:DNA-binding response OmpR family regulator n=1 Tax=Paenibacillus eucommiae TaxID=1355755 RepID=A0ABS4JAW0_9BACL|nr:response regulator transcription factor [Paenibacillus eucommiae]MBP1996983.1 DNA-binding response OmpR family regulator [Paenibacillus eucommiae]
MTKQSILVVDDHKEITELIYHYLVEFGFDVVTKNNPREVFAAVEQQKPDLVILDIMMPGMDGIEVCKELRKTSNLPILFLSSRKDDVDKVLALGVGGDDYITKPFSPRELVARVQAHLRRNSLLLPLVQQQPASLKFENMEIDPDTHIVTAYGNTINLSAKEFDLLFQLASYPNRLFNSEQLFEIIWGGDSLGDLRTVMVHLSTLRRKIEKDPANPAFISTIRGVGYKFIGQPQGQD